MYCQNAAANVLDKDGALRFNYDVLKSSLDSVSRGGTDLVDARVMVLYRKIVDLCNMKHGEQNEFNELTLVLTLLNIHAAYLMISGLWKEEPTGTDEYGFEIF
jgi:hypothetical protein